MRVLTSNIEWVRTTWWRGEPVLDRLRTEAADIAILTEAQVPLVRELYDHVVDAGPHPRANQPDGSKVVVASRHPMEVVDLHGSDDLPPHNFVAVDVLPSGGERLRVIGVVIRYNQKREYIEALPPVLDRLVDEHTVFAGDFNLSMLRARPLERCCVQRSKTPACGSPRPDRGRNWRTSHHSSTTSRCREVSRQWTAASGRATSTARSGA